VGISARNMAHQHPVLGIIALSRVPMLKLTPNPVSLLLLPNSFDARTTWLTQKGQPRPRNKKVLED